MHPNKPTKVAAQVAALWTDHHDHVARIIAKRTRRRSTDPLIEDALAETMVRVIRHLASGRTIDDPAGLLRTIAWREYLRQLERHGRTVPTDPDGEDRALTDPDTAEQLVLDGLTAQLDGQLQRALARLTPRERAVLTDNHAGYTYDEIAQRHDLSWSAVNKAMYRATRKLRQDGALQKAYREWSD